MCHQGGSAIEAALSGFAPEIQQPAAGTIPNLKSNILLNLEDVKQECIILAFQRIQYLLPLFPSPSANKLLSCQERQRSGLHYIIEFSTVLKLTSCLYIVKVIFNSNSLNCVSENTLQMKL